MDFDFGEKEEAARREIREFVRQELPPGWLMGRLEEESRDEDWEFAMSISRKLSKRGWLTMSWPKEYGGKGATLWEQMVYREKAGYWAIPGVTCFWHDVLCIMSEDVPHALPRSLKGATPRVSYSGIKSLIRAS